MSGGKYILYNARKTSQYTFNNVTSKEHNARCPTARLIRTGVQVKAKANNVEGANELMVQTDGAANERKATVYLVRLYTVR